MSISIFHMPWSKVLSMDRREFSGLFPALCASMARFSQLEYMLQCLTELCPDFALETDVMVFIREFPAG